MKRILLIFVSLFLILSLVGCNKNNQQLFSNYTTDLPEAKTLTLAYCANDVINPYTAVTEFNKKLSSLIFDCLVKLNNDFSVANVLAESIVLTNNKCTVTLKNAHFSDGTEVTSADVIYSLKYAENSGYYPDLFESIISCSENGSNSIIFTLEKFDPNFSALLTFPIIKNGTGELKTDNNLSIPPIGSGMYVPDFENMQLSCNQYYLGSTPKQKVISLVNTPDYEALRYGISTGKISFWLDSYRGSNTITASGGTRAIPQNSFIYLGINLNNEHLMKPQLRYALSAILDRQIIANEVFDNYATPTSGIYNPNWNVVKNIQENIITQNQNIFVANLEEIGYNKLDTLGYRLTNSGKQLSLKLIYCNDSLLKVSLANEIIFQYQTAGIRINAVGLEYDDYLSALINKDFDLYLAETIIPNNMDVSELLLKDGKINFGSNYLPPEGDAESVTEDAEITEAEEDELIDSLDEMITAFYSGNAELYEIINMFNLEMPLIPICYESAVLSYQSGITVNANLSPNNPYSTVADCDIK